MVCGSLYNLAELRRVLETQEQVSYDMVLLYCRAFRRRSAMESVQSTYTLKVVNFQQVSTPRNGVMGHRSASLLFKKARSSGGCR